MDMLNGEPPRYKPNWWKRFLIWIAGGDLATLKSCPAHDWDNMYAVAWLMIATWVYQTGLFTIVGNRLFAEPGQFQPLLLLPSMFCATFVMLIDSYMIMRSGWHLGGIQELKRGGIDISGGPAARLKAGLFLSVRIVLSLGLAQLTAIFVSLLIFGHTIDAQVRDTYLKANAHLVGPATALIDGMIKRATDAYNAEIRRVNDLAAQVATLRQNEIDPSANDAQIQAAQQEVAQLTAEKTKADDAVAAAQAFADDELGGIKGSPLNSGREGRGLRYAAAGQKVTDAQAHDQAVTARLAAARKRLDDLRQQVAAGNVVLKQQAHAQLPGFEATLRTERKALADLKEQLEKLIAGRDAAIRAAIEQAPDHVEVDNGLIAQITVLKDIAEKNRDIAVLILLIDFVSFGFELAAVLAKVTSYVPTTYATILARDAYMGAVRIVDEMTDELNKRGGGGSSEDPTPASPVDPPGGIPGSGGAVVSPFEGTEEPIPPAPQPLTAKRKRGRPRKYPLTSPNGQDKPKAA